MKEDSLLTRFFGKKRALSKTFENGRRSKSLRFESLEDRALLSVSAAELAAIAESYSEIAPGDWNELNVVELSGVLSETALRDAVRQAQNTPQNDLIVVRTTAENDAINLSSPLVVDFDSDVSGTLTVVGFGDSSLKLRGRETVLEVSSGLVALGNVSFVGAFDAGAAASSPRNLLKTSGDGIALTQGVSFTVELDAPTVAVGSKDPTSLAPTEPKSAYYAVETYLGDNKWAYIANVEVAPGETLDGALHNVVTDLYSDVNKTWSKDSLLCWAASASNMLAYAGWGPTGSASDGTTIFNDFKAHFKNVGGNTMAGIQWYFSGYLSSSYQEKLIDVDNPGGGYYTQAEFNAAYDQSDVYRCVSLADLNEMATRLRAGDAVGLSAGWYSSSDERTNGHALTVYGYVYNDSYTNSNANYYAGIILADSDDRANGLGAYEIGWNSSKSAYQITDDAYYVASLGGAPRFDRLFYLAQNDGGSTRLAAPRLKATNVTATSITVSWNAVPNASGYAIGYWKVGSSVVDGEWELSASTTSHTITGLQPNTNYVVAAFAIGSGQYEDSAEFELNVTTTSGTASNDDAYEENDAFETAYDLGTIRSTTTISNLKSLGSDDDWFKFTIAAGAGGYAQITYSSSISDVDAKLCDSNGKQVGYSDDVSGVEKISFDGLASGTYYLHIYNLSKTASNPYSLTITPPFSSDTIPLSPPTLLVTSVTTSTIAMKWSAVANADGYEISYWEEGADEVAKIWELPASTTSHTITGLKPDTRYVVASRSLGSGDYADSTKMFAVSVKTSSPDDAYEENDTFATAYDLGTLSSTKTISNLKSVEFDEDWFKFTITSGNGGSAQMAYASSISNLEMQLYDRYKNLVGYSASSSGAESISLSGLASGEYYLRVYNMNVATANPYSLTLVPPTSKKTLSTPTNLRATTLSSSSIQLTWTDVSNEAYYEIQYRKSGSSSWTTCIMPSNRTACTLVGLDANATYYCRIKAVASTSGNYADSAYTAEVSATTLAAPDNVGEPQLRATNVTATSITVNWDVVPNASGYVLGYWQEDADEVEEIWELSASTTSHTITGLQPNTKYVVAAYAVGSGAYQDSDVFELLVTTSNSETPETPSTVVTTASVVVDPYDGLISLPEAIEYAEDGATITFDAAAFATNQTISLNGNCQIILKNLTIDGAVGSKTITLDAEQKERALAISSPGKTVALKNLVVANARHSTAGVGLWTESGTDLTLENVEFRNCVGDVSANYIGGAICLNSSASAPSKLTVVDSRFIDDAIGFGGAICVGDYGVATISETTFSGNQAGASGGAVYLCPNSVATITASTFDGNASGTSGGAIFNGGSKLTLIDCVGTGNNGGYYGGFLNAHFGTDQTLINCTISGNTSSDRGGGICCGGKLTIEGGSITENSSINGGGLLTDGGDPESSDLPTTITNCVIARNVAEWAGAIFNDDGSLTLIGSSIWGNTSVYSGGAFYNRDELTAINCAITGNVGNYGGGIFNQDANSTATLKNTIVAFNKAKTSGDDIFKNTSSIDGCNVLTNFADWTNSANVVGYAADTKIFVVDPQFDANGNLTNAASVDLRLAEGSPAIDAGNNAYVPADLATDLDGNARIQGGTVDLGAYEFSLVLKTALTSVAIKGKFEVGQTLTATVSPNGATATYQWYRGTTEISGATGSTYTLQAADVGRMLTVVATGTGNYSGTVQAAIGKVKETPSTVVTAASFVVDAYDGLISFPEAIKYAEDGATITFDANAFAANPTLTFDQQFKITKSVKIDGAVGSKTMTFDGGGSSRIFYLDASGVALELSNLVVANCASDYAGGAIWATSGVALTLDSVVFRNNKLKDGSKYFGGAICVNSSAEAPSRLTIRDSQFIGNSAYRGGALYVVCVATISNTTFSGNTAAQYGGAAYFTGGVTIFNSTFSENTAVEQGGGALCLDDSGATRVVGSTFSQNEAVLGGAVMACANATFENSAFWGNVCANGGGGVYDYAASTFVNCSLVGNVAKWGGGVALYSSGTTFKNTIVALNKATDSGDDVKNALGSSSVVINGYNVLSSFNAWTSGGNNVLYDASKPLFVVAPQFDANGNLTNAASVDLRLAEGSPAIDAGNNAYVPADLATDLDGNARIQGGTVDLGAYEFDGETPETPSTVVTTATDVVDPYDGKISLREAIAYAENGATITFDATVFANNQTITLAGTQLEIAKNVKIDGKVGSKTITLDGAAKSRVVYVAEGATVELANLTIQNGESGFVDDIEKDLGGGIYNAGTLTATNLKIVDNEARKGGGVYNLGTLTATDVEIVRNAAVFGGGIYADGGTIDATNLDVSENSAISGGGIFANAGTITATNLELLDNDATSGQGGGFYCQGGTLTATNVAIVGNDANQGGGIHIGNPGVAFTGTNVLIAGNSAEKGGGVSVAHAATFTATNATISGNAAAIGGAIYNDDRYSPVNVALYNAIVALNKATTSDDDIAKTTANVSGFNVLTNFADWTESANVVGYAANSPIFVVAPQFDANGKPTNANELDLRLAENSPAINAGNNDYVPTDVATDLAGNARIQNGTVDLGAYESAHNPKTALTSVSIAGTLKVGETLTATVSPNGATATFQWYRGTTKISGATSATYTIQTADVGFALKVVATGTGNYAGTAEAATAVVPSSEPWCEATAQSVAAADGVFTVSLDLALKEDLRNSGLQLEVAYDASEVSFVAVGSSSVAGAQTNHDASGQVVLYQWFDVTTQDGLIDDLVSGLQFRFQSGAKSATIVATLFDVNGNEATATLTVRAETPEPLKTPKITKTEVGASGILVRWGKVANASGYEARFTNVATGEVKTVTVAAGKTSALLSDWESATTYSITVKALGGTNYADSEFSAAVRAKTWKRITTPKITGIEVETGVLVKWGKVYGAASYTVTCVPVGASDAKTVSATFAADKSQGLFNILRPETKYSITVKANAPSGTQSTASEPSAAVEVATNPMAAPTLIGGSPHAGSKGILLKWKAVNGATGYQIETRAAGSTDAYTIATVDASTTAFVASEISRSLRYEIRIKALGLDGVYADSAYTETTLEAKILATPKVTKVVVRANGDLLVNWQKAYGAASYAIEYKLDGASEYTAITGIPSSAGNKTLTGLVPGATYTIRVKAVGSGSYADSDYSSEATATTAGRARTTAFAALDSVFADWDADEDDDFWAAF